MPSLFIILPRIVRTTSSEEREPFWVELAGIRGLWGGPVVCLRGFQHS